VDCSLWMSNYVHLRGVPSGDGPTRCAEQILGPVPANGTA
jgi:hypothetical protein